MININRLYLTLFDRHVIFQYNKLNVNLIGNNKIAKFYSKQKFKEMKYLNVAEKNDAAKNIASILSNGASRRREGLCVYNKIYEFEANVKNQNSKMVMTSVSGHLLNYEFSASYKGWNNCSPDQLFDAPIRKGLSDNDTGVKIKKTIEREIRSCQGLIIWTDCDREGENIGFEIIEVCHAIRPNLKIFRAKFSEITRAAIFRALNNLGQPDKRQNEAVEIRQELDLRTGAAFTRYQTLRLQRLFPGTTADKLISYGSCQIPTLGFVAERYKEVEDFVSEPFWKLKVTHTIDDLTVEFNWARNRLFNKEAVEDYLLLCLADPKAKVENKTVKPKNKWRPQPMDTVELEKLGSRKLKINAKETMTIAEKLYSKGFISYPRTETNSFSSEINLRSLVEQHTPHTEWGDFARKVLEWGPNPRNGKKTDEAHPPIHPTKFVTGLSGNEARIYELIVRHFLACVSKDATGSETIVYIDIAGEKFSANGLVIYERNYLDVYPYEKWNAKQIHHYEIDQIFEPTEISMQEGATTAPPLLTEADLIALMEKHGIGTDATHAEHIHTIKERGYIGEVDRGLLVPGTIGMGLYEGYGAMDLELAKPRLRAEFESDLKKICNGEKNAKAVLREQIIKYKEAYNLITQRIGALDEKFASRVNETPSNRRNDRPDNDRDRGGGSSNRNNRNNGGDNSSDDDGDDGNNPPGGGGAASSIRQNSNNTDDDFMPQPLQEVFACPKCKISQMALRKKRDGNSYMIGCTNFPDCKNVVWLSDAIKEAKVSASYCHKCGNKTNKSSLSKKMQFKFKNPTYLALLNSLNDTYTTCIRCDSKFREALDINLDQVKWVGSIVADSNTTTSSNVTKLKPTANSKASKTKKPEKIFLEKKTATTHRTENFSTNSKSIPIIDNDVKENIGWVFDDGNDLFGDDGFDDGLDNVLINLDANQEPKNDMETIDSSAKIKQWKELNNFKTKNEVNAYFTNWGNSSSNSNTNSSQLNSPIAMEWGTSKSNCNQNYANPRKEITNSRTTSTWTKADFANTGSGAQNKKDQMEQPAFKKFKKTDYSQGNPSNRMDNTNFFQTDESHIKCRTCNKSARKLVVKKEGPNTGREFYSCDSSCKFFQWADQEVENHNFHNIMLENSTISFLKCNCGKSVTALQVRKDGPNQGKWFYKCAEDKCKYFKWDKKDNDEFDDFMNEPASTSSSWGTSKVTKKKNLGKQDDGPKKRRCGLCRMEGHTKNKCPRKEEFGMD